jgi:hypothetical protein
MAKCKQMVIWYHSTKTRTLENGRKIASGYYSNPLPIANVLLVSHAFAESTFSPEIETSAYIMPTAGNGLNIASYALRVCTHTGLDSLM